jgi:hypothetical protein
MRPSPLHLFEGQFGSPPRHDRFWRKAAGDSCSQTVRCFSPEHMLIKRQPVWISRPCLLGPSAFQPELTPFLGCRRHHVGLSYDSCRNIATGRVIDCEYGHEPNPIIKALSLPLKRFDNGRHICIMPVEGSTRKLYQKAPRRVSKAKPPVCLRKRAFCRRHGGTTPAAEASFHANSGLENSGLGLTVGRGRCCAMKASNSSLSLA